MNTQSHKPNLTTQKQPQPSMKHNYTPLLIAALIVVGVSRLSAVEALLTDDSFVANGRSLPASPVVRVSSATMGLLKFSLETLPAGTQPADVVTANLRLYVSSLKRTGDIVVSGKDLAAAQSVITLDEGDRKSHIALPVTEIVKAWLGGAQNNGFEITTTNDAAVSFDSKENAATSHPAVLEIELNPVASLLVGSGSEAGKIDGSKIAAGSVGGTQLGSNLVLPGTTTGTFSGTGTGLTVSGGNITTGSIPIAALAPRVVTSPNATAPVGGVARSGTVDVSIVGTGAAADLAGLTVKLTTTGQRPVFVGFINGTLRADATGDEGGGQRTAGAELQIQRDGSTIATTAFLQRNLNNVSTTSQWPAGSFWTIDPSPGAGEITYKIQGKLSGSQCSASFGSAILVAFEL